MDILDLTAVELGRQIRSGQVSAVEAVRAALLQIEAAEPSCHAFIQIDTSYRNGKTLFVIKDSYANSMIPLLTPHYQRIYVVDLRYYNGRLSALMKQMEPEEGMDVLVLYNCIHFLEEFCYTE